MVCPPDQLAELAALLPVPVVDPVTAPPEAPWEEALVKKFGADALATLRGNLDMQTDAINHQLDRDLEQVLKRLAEACPPLDEHPFYSPPPPRPAPA